MYNFITKNYCIILLFFKTSDKINAFTMKQRTLEFLYNNPETLINNSNKLTKLPNDLNVILKLFMKFILFL